MLSVCLSDAIQRVLDPIAGEGGPRSRAARAESAARKNGPKRRAPSRAEVRATGERNGSVRHLTDRRGKAS